MSKTVLNAEILLLSYWNENESVNTVYRTNRLIYKGNKRRKNSDTEFNVSAKMNVQFHFGETRRRNIF